MNKATPTSEWMKPMNETVTIDRTQATETGQHPQALLELAHGEARQSLLTVHGILEATLPAGELSIYEPAAARPASCRSRCCTAPTSP